MQIKGTIPKHPYFFNFFLALELNFKTIFHDAARNICFHVAFGGAVKLIISPNSLQTYLKYCCNASYFCDCLLKSFLCVQI